MMMIDDAKDDETPDDDAPESGDDNDGGDSDGEGDGEGEEKGGDKKKLIILAAIPLVLLLVGGGLFFSGMLDSLLGKGEVAEESEHGEEMAEGDGHGKKKDDHGKKKDDHGKKKKKKGDDHGDGYDEGGGGIAFLEIPPITVNLYAEDGTPRYLRLTVQLEMESGADKAAVEAVMPRVIDQFQTYLRELRVKDLRGSAGIYRLQMELLWRVNQAAAPVEVQDVLFQEILIQ